MSGLKREDEYRLKQLQQQAADEGRQNMLEDDQLLLLLLEDRYNKFLDEGLKKLRESSPKSPPRGLSRIFSSTIGRPRQAADSEAKQGSSPAASASSTPVANHADGAALSNDSNLSFSTKNGAGGSSSGFTLASSAPIQASGKHWTWILENLVVGAIPYAAPTPDTPGHLCELVEQCFQRKSQVAAVVSCMDIDEATPAGFAVTKDWETFLNTNTFLHCSVIPNGVQTVLGGSMTWTNMSFALASTAATGSAQANAVSQVALAADDGVSESRKGFSDQTTVVAPAASSPGTPTADATTAAKPHSPQRVEAFETMLQLCQQVEKLLRPTGSSSASVSPTGQAAAARSRLSFASKKDAVEKRRVVYVHCKAGTCRSWAFAMCYLLTQTQRPYDECDAYLRSLRAFHPKQVQIDFVRQFAVYIEQPREPEISPDEEKYFRILADVLSLPQKFRLKLIRDLEKLT